MVRLATPNGYIEFEDRRTTVELLKNQQAVEAAAKWEAEIANRSYHMGRTPTPGRGYDDRLTARLGLSTTTCYEYIKLDPKRGGLVARQVGSKWLITEEAVRAFEGRKQAA
jgi:hypothetical protein